MNNWQNDELHEILGCKNTEDVFSLLHKEAKNLMGMEHAAWGGRLPGKRPGEDQYVMMNSYDTAWQEHYAAANFMNIDPVVIWCSRSTIPVPWHQIKHQAPLFFEEAQSYGLDEGISQSVRDYQNAGSILSVSRSAEKLSVSELRHALPKVSWLAQVVHAAMTRILMPEIDHQTADDLTKREKEMLRLAADGLTSSQIAEKLRISVKTPDFHLNNAKKKLNASSRTEAIFKAAALGILR